MLKVNNLVGFGVGREVATYRYLRLKANSSGTGNYSEIAKLAFVAASVEHPTGTMTTNSWPSPFVALADSEYSATYEAWKAFDNNSGTFWSANTSAFPHWLQIDLGAGNGIAPTAVIIAPSTTITMAPYTFDVLGSNTGAFAGEETTLYSASPGASGWTVGVDRTFTF